jgi:NAD(P)-dependent dehydrogenase (short-subunit alcohol dehydrogenase family)
LRERIVEVTGAPGALCGAVVEAVLAAGDHVTGMSRSQSERQGGNYLHVAADQSSPAAVTSAFSDVISRFGRVDVVAHTMGGFAGGTAIQDTGDDVWTKMMNMNLNSAFFVFRAALKHMTAAGRGRLIAIGSRASVLPASGLSAYSASKAALNSLVQTAAVEARDSGITVNCVLPSVIDTAANRSWGSAEQQAKWVTPESIANQVLWLASDDAAELAERSSRFTAAHEVVT